MITELFIKQCEQAKGIQCERILGRYEFGDLYYLESGFKHGGKFRFIGSYDGYNTDKELVEKSIWLPTQEQLQEMLHNYYQNNNSNAKGLEWGDSINEYMLNQLLNFEKDNREIVYDLNSLWLAFVMHELYNKVWTGEKWEATK